MYEKTHTEGMSGVSSALRGGIRPNPASKSHFVSFYSTPPKEDRDTRGVEMLPISRASEFHLATPAVTRAVYVAHPTQPWKLYAFADYENSIAAEKLNEAIRIMQTLGACEVIAYSFRGTQSEAEAKAGYSGFGANMRFTNAEGWKAKVSCQGEGSTPTDPRPLAFPDEPGFDAVCEAVIKNGATEYQLEIVTGHKFALDGGLATPLKAAGFELSAGGERSKSSHFVIQARFPKRGAVAEVETSAK